MRLEGEPNAYFAYGQQLSQARGLFHDRLVFQRKQLRQKRANSWLRALGGTSHRQKSEGELKKSIIFDKFYLLLSVPLVRKRDFHRHPATTLTVRARVSLR